MQDEVGCFRTFNVIVPMKPAFTVTGSLSEFSASAFNFKSLSTTSPENRKDDISSPNQERIKAKIDECRLNMTIG